MRGQRFGGLLVDFYAANGITVMDKRLRR